MNDVSIPSGDRIVLYQNIFQKYQNQYESIVRPSHIPVQEQRKDDISELKSEKREEVDLNKSIIEGLLTSKSRDRGITLYETLNRVPGLEWNDSGIISIDGKEINNSSIIDLVIDLTKKWKRNPPSFWNEVKQKLETSSFPKSVIINPDRMGDINRAIPTTTYNPSIRRRIRQRESTPYPKQKTVLNWLKYK